MKKTKVISGLFWKFAERIGAQGVNLIVSIILARILSPNDYGIIALTSIFITISNVFVERGFQTALIQKKDADNLDFSSAFYCNIIISIIMYIIIFFSAPIIANFYNNTELVAILRVLGIGVLVSGVKSIQQSYVAKNMMFKKFFVSTLVGTIISAIVGILMAYNGYGVWSLVAQQLTNLIIDTIILWITVKWRPLLKFSIQRVKSLFEFGWRMLCSGIIDSIYNELYGLTIGKVYNTTQLAYYNKANQIPKLLMTNIDGSISTVILPVLVDEQDNKERMKNMVKRAIKTSAFLLFPIMFGLAAVSETLVIILLTEKWLPSVSLMQLLCFSYAIWPIHSINLQAISAMGRSDIFLKLEIIKKVVGIIGLIISIPMGVNAMVAIQLVTSVISAFINAYPNKKLINYSFMEQIKDIAPYLFISLFMYFVVSILDFLVVNYVLKMVIQVLVGAVTYIGVQFILHTEEFVYFLNGLKEKVKEKERIKEVA